jgi:hypothetical protein
MESFIYLFLLIITVVLFKIILKIDFKKAKKLKQNKEIEAITNKFPNDIQIAQEMLEMLNNKSVKIEQAQNTETSLYIAITNKISIADMKNNYARIQTIAHECIHSCQDRLLLMFNFIFSNIKLIYFLTITVLTILKIINNYYIQFAIFTLFTLIEFSIRSFLEIDAMTKAKFLAKEYMQNKNFCTKEEIEKVIKQYEKINKIGIPFVIDNLLTNEIMMILIYNIICIIMKII